MKNARTLGVGVGYLFAILWNASCGWSSSIEQGLLLSQNGTSPFQIVLPQEASVAERSAAEELQLFLEQMTGAKLPITDDVGELPARAILLGNNRHLSALDVAPDWSALGDEGFIIRTTSAHLVIAGGPRSGTLHGVYEFLEEVLGCRWFAPGVSRIPKTPTLRLPALNIQKVPTFEYRLLIWPSALDPAWAARNHLNAAVDAVFHAVKDDPRMSEIWSYAGPMAHSFPDLVPADRYFDEHPEYFSEVDGQRLRRDYQPCMTNPEVLPIAVATAKQWIAARPKARIVSISMGDWNNFCQCDQCSAAAVRMGGDVAVYFDFVNRVAEQIGHEYPHILVDTLAYSSVKSVPPNIRMQPNVVVRFADWDICRVHSLDQCQHNIDLGDVQTLRQWVKISPRVWYWYYTFRDCFLYPFDNLTFMSRTFKLLRDLGIKGIFVEGQSRFANDDLAQLKAYIIAKLCWNPDYDVENGIQEFLEGYYGAAAPQMAAYLDLLRQEQTYQGSDRSPLSDSEMVARLGRPLSYSGEHCDQLLLAFIQPAALKDADKIFASAEQAVRGQPELVDRVRVARLSVWHLMLLHLPKDDPNRQRAAKEFFTSAQRLNVGWVGSRDQTLDDFKAWVMSR